MSSLCRISWPKHKSGCSTLETQCWILRQKKDKMGDAELRVWWQRQLPRYSLCVAGASEANSDMPLLSQRPLKKGPSLVNLQQFATESPSNNPGGAAGINLSQQIACFRLSPMILIRSKPESLSWSQLGLSHCQPIALSQLTAATLSLVEFWPALHRSREDVQRVGTATLNESSWWWTVSVQFIHCPIQEAYLILARTMPVLIHPRAEWYPLLKRARHQPSVLELSLPLLRVRSHLQLLPLFISMRACSPLQFIAAV